MSIKSRKISNLQDFLRYLFSDLDSKDTIYWYRGQANEKWPLLPAMARSKKYKNKEAIFLSRFKQNAVLLMNNHKPNNDWEWLTVMQHHGAPTRLLDWSESPLVALYFATNPEQKTSGALWILNPLMLNKHAKIRHDDPKFLPSLDFNNDVVKAYTPEQVNSSTSETLELDPIAIIPPHTTMRMQAQQGVFTVIHRKQIAIEDVDIDKKLHIRKYIIEHKHKTSIRKELEILGISYFQLFPELASVGKIIKE